MNKDTPPADSGLVDQIGREIISGGFAAGSLLPNEAEMRDRYSISRTALREAYSKLMAKGLVSARPKVGTSVRPRAHWNMLDQDVLSWHLQTVPAEDIAADLYTLRRMIEPATAELAAKIRTDQDMEKIAAAFEAMKANATQEGPLIEADFSFHLAILNATRNPFINAFSALIRAAMVSTFELSWRGAEVIKDQRLAQHGDVVDAIRAQDSATARAAMELLLDESIEDVSEALIKR
ncbi:MAG: FadR family transcriptional regulator [Rhodobacteraceae bacterium]|nr:FadR family transcriptional regulator [Paracoccaceae bacterium]